MKNNALQDGLFFKCCFWGVYMVPIHKIGFLFVTVVERFSNDGIAKMIIQLSQSFERGDMQERMNVSNMWVYHCCVKNR